MAAKSADVSVQVFLQCQGQYYRIGPPGLVRGPSQGQGLGLCWQPVVRTSWQVSLASLEYVS